MNHGGLVDHLPCTCTRETIPRLGLSLFPELCWSRGKHTSGLAATCSIDTRQRNHELRNGIGPMHTFIMHSNSTLCLH
jgi:hypothetical protein